MPNQEDRYYRSNKPRYTGGYRNDDYTMDYNMKRFSPGRPNHDDTTISTTIDSDLTYSREGCSTFAKYAMFTVNIIFGIVGFACLALGAWLRTDSRFREFLSERYRQAVEEAFWQAPTLYAFTYILIVFGAKDGIDVELSDALNYMVQHYYQGPGIVQESLDRLQTTFRCCGNAGCGDFLQLRLDYPRSCDIRCDGCHHRIWIALSIGASVAVVLFGAVIIGQFLAIFISLSLVFSNKEEDDYQRYRRNYIEEHNNPAYISSPPQNFHNSNKRYNPKNEYTPGRRAYSPRYFAG
uniref:Tetraspanin n=1 Tax=Parastrongyloides trichosuri TaxID=131310 RepID=A0A0N4Z9J4_PARTI